MARTPAAWRPPVADPETLPADAPQPAAPQTDELPLIAVVGATASGKSDWALALAERLNGEIIGADSRQIYRGLDIGTAKPSSAARARVPHHLVGHVDPRERYHLARYLEETRAALAGIRARGRRPILAGGTGQYVWALLEGWNVPAVAPDLALRAELQALAVRKGPSVLHAALAAVDPAAAERINPNNVRRVIRALEVERISGRPISSWHETRDPLDALILGPTLERPALDARIEARVRAMFQAGLVEEVRALLAGGLPANSPGLGTIGYREVVRHLRGALTLPDAEAAVMLATRQLARRQVTWFRRDDARIQWLHSQTEALNLAECAP